jgi:hypothetical protein
VAAFLTALGVSTAANDPGPRAPARLAIYYGIPSLVNGAGGDVGRAARTFAEYDVVVFGDGLQYDVPRSGGPSAGPLEHARTRAIVRELAALNAEALVFGYVPLGDTLALPMPAIVDAIRRWRALGVNGIFLDEAGFDFGVTRARQTEAIQAARAEGLRVFVNAFDPDDVFSSDAKPVNARGGGNPLGAPSALRAGDLLLIESFVVRNGEAEPDDRWFERSRKASAHSRRTGVGVMTVTTTTSVRSFDEPLCRTAWWAAVLWGFDGFGWGEPAFSAPSSALPPRRCHGTGLPGNAGPYVSDVTREGSRFVRRAQRATVEVDFARREGRTRPSAAITQPAGQGPSSAAPTPERAGARMWRDVPRGTAPA